MTETTTDTGALAAHDLDAPAATLDAATSDAAATNTSPELSPEARRMVDALMAQLAPSPGQAFRDFIQSDSFPCVGAKAALVRDQITVAVLGDITTPSHDVALYKAIRAYTDTLVRDKPIVQSFAAIFPDTPPGLCERGFEASLWERLQCLHNLDAVQGVEWAKDASRDPASPHFSMSIGGEAYFVVGLHPNASRPARCFRYPVLVFNSHDQFERMRLDGRYDQMKGIIRQRDTLLSGDINPMLDDFGGSSEALQYSGRLLEDGWKCPFSAKTQDDPTITIKPISHRGSRRR